MQIHLDSEIFEQVKSGTKDIEARVNDEKRQQLKIGDIIEVLRRPDGKEALKVRIISLTYFKDFRELTNSYPIERLYSPSFTKEQYLALFPKFYTDEEIAKYGTVAIGFKKIED